jgi:hypothetical protein
VVGHGAQRVVDIEGIYLWLAIKAGLGLVTTLQLYQLDFDDLQRSTGGNGQGSGWCSGERRATGSGKRGGGGSGEKLTAIESEGAGVGHESFPDEDDLGIAFVR